MEPVDLILLQQPRQVVPQPVLEALQRQGEVSLNLFTLTGERRPSDRHRWETLARARNQAKSLGSAPLVMFLDSDVVLPEGTMEQLAQALAKEPRQAAVAADYRGEAGRPPGGHVGMGATLFRREALQRVTFRWEENKCECLCCCEDLRRMGWRIEYLPGCSAQHLRPEGVPRGMSGSSPTPSLPPVVYVCATCGKQYLVPAPCCHQPTQAKPLLFCSVAQSPHAFADIEFSIVMLTKNNVAWTQVAVESLLRDCPPEKTEFIFVDSGSTDGSWPYFQDLALRCQVKFILTHPQEPFIYGRNNNRGVRAAVGRYLLLVNNDVEILGEGLYDLLRRVLDHPQVGAAGVSWFAGWHREHREQIVQETREGYWLGRLPLPGYFWALRRTVFWEVGGMDETFSGYGHDEVEMQYRLVKANYLLAILDIPLRHEGTATYRQETTSEEFGKLHQRNLDTFLQKHGHLPTLLFSGKGPFLSHPAPVISVAIATRDYARFLPRCLDSVLNSRNPTPAPLQIVVVDDASTDETPLLLHQYQQRYPEVFNLLRLPVQNGVAVAKNRALERCIGRYVALLDADDEFFPDKLEVCYRVLEETGCDLVSHDFLARTPEHPTPFPAWFGFPEPLLRDYRPPSTWMFRNGSVRFNEQMVGGVEDLEWFLRVWPTLRTRHIPRPLCIYQRHPQQHSQTSEGILTGGQVLHSFRQSLRQS